MTNSSGTEESTAGAGGDGSGRERWWNRLGKNAVVVASVGAW